MSDELDSPRALVHAYQAGGMVGWIDSPRDRGIFSEAQPYPVYAEPNIAGSGVGKRACLWQYLQRLDRGAYTERQTKPDCTSHAARNACDTTRAVEILVKGEPEDFYLRGATEPTYGARGHGGGGMSPARAAMWQKDVGYLVRKKYDAVDLSKYDGSIGDRWGRNGVPAEVQALCNEQKVRTIRQIQSVRDAIDALFNGYALMSGQYAAWSESPNAQHYYTRVSPGWSHAMATVGYDDTKTFWPKTVFFIVNSWAAWNQAPKEWPKDMPAWVPGMIVTTAEDWAVCVDTQDCYAYGNVDGYPPQRLPDLGSIGLLRA